MPTSLRLLGHVAPLLVMAFCGSVAAQAPERKPITENDTWTYRQTSTSGNAPDGVYHIRFGVVTKNVNGSYVLGRTAGKPAHGAQTVWTLLGVIGADTCLRDLNGQAALGLANTCNVQLDAGKRWEIRRSDSLDSELTNFTVIGREEVQVPAGRFNAIKIEARGVVTVVAYPGVAAPPQGYEQHRRTTYWFVPELKTMAKIHRELGPTPQMQTSILEELEEYRAN